MLHGRQGLAGKGARRVMPKVRVRLVRVRVRVRVTVKVVVRVRIRELSQGYAESQGHRILALEAEGGGDYFLT